MPIKKIVIFGQSSSTHLYKWSKSLQMRGYSVRIVSLGNSTIDGIDVVNLPRNNKLSYFTNASEAKDAALEFNPDIIHVHYAGGYGIWGLKTKFAPMVVSVWGSDINNSSNNWIHKYFIKKLLKRADKITATSHSLFSNTIKLVPSIENKLSVIPFGVEIPDKQFEHNTDNGLSAVYLKQLEKVYAPDILIKATALVVEKFPDFKLTIGGSGSMENSLKQLVSLLKLENSVSIIGFYDNSKIYNLIKEHNFLIMPSLEEGFGVAAVEAFACARPVIATNVGGIPEIVTDNVNGYLVEPNNIDSLASAIKNMLSNKNRMIQMGQEGYKVAIKKYNWQDSVDKMIKIYDLL